MLYLFIDVAKPITLKCFPTYFDVGESISRLGCCPFADTRPYCGHIETILRHETAINIGLNPSSRIAADGSAAINMDLWIKP